jgi:hypothetical protein
MVANSHPRVELTQALVDFLRRGIFARESPLRLGPTFDDLYALAFRVSATRQFESIRAILALIPLQLGHLRVGYVRPACDEYLWLAYLNTMGTSAATRVILAMNLDESARSLEAQLGFMGEAGFVSLGFPRNIVASHRLAADQALRTVARIEGWPGTGNRVPSTRWIAEASGNLGATGPITTMIAAVRIAGHAEPS